MKNVIAVSRGFGQPGPEIGRPETATHRSPAAEGFFHDGFRTVRTRNCFGILSDEPPACLQRVVGWFREVVGQRFLGYAANRTILELAKCRRTGRPSIHGSQLLTTVSSSGSCAVVAE